MAKPKPLRDCRHITADEIATAPVRCTNSVDLPVTPAQLFEVLADAGAWPLWAGAITKVTWTSEPPIGVGTTRVVDMRGGIVGDEEFLTWEPPTAMAFRFNRTNAPGLEAFGEHYEVVETAEGCRVTWTLSMWPVGIQKPIMAVTRPVLDLAFASFLRKLRKVCRERYPATAG